MLFLSLQKPPDHSRGLWSCHTGSRILQPNINMSKRAPPIRASALSAERAESMVNSRTAKTTSSRQTDAKTLALGGKQRAVVSFENLTAASGEFVAEWVRRLIVVRVTNHGADALPPRRTMTRFSSRSRCAATSPHGRKSASSLRACRNSRSGCALSMVPIP